MDFSTPGFPVHHQLSDLVQTHVHWVSDAIQPAYPLLSPSAPAISLYSIRVFSNQMPKVIRASASVLPMTIQGWFPSGLIGLISLLSKELSGVFSSATIQKHQFFAAQLSLMVQLSHLYMTTRKTIALIRWVFIDQVTSLLLNMLFRFVIAFLPGSKHLLISWLQSSSIRILETKKIKSVTASTFPPSICNEVMGPDAMIFTFWMLS